jgi:hypothetical protein
MTIPFTSEKTTRETLTTLFLKVSISTIPAAFIFARFAAGSLGKGRKYDG